MNAWLASGARLTQVGRHDAMGRKAAMFTVGFIFSPLPAKNNHTSA